FSYVYDGSKTFFSTEHYQQMVHALGPYWYPQALLLWSTPLQLLSLILVAVAAVKFPKQRLLMGFLVLFCLLFFLEVQYSIKKGDRYILPVFMAIDVLAAIGISQLLPLLKTK